MEGEDRESGVGEAARKVVNSIRSSVIVVVDILNDKVEDWNEEKLVEVYSW
jgi:hypothetical protein